MESTSITILLFAELFLTAKCRVQDPCDEQYDNISYAFASDSEEREV